MRSVFAVAAASIVLAACVPKAPPPADPAAVKAAIEAANNKFVAAMKAGDTVTAAGNYADDAVVMQPNDVAWKGRAAITHGFAGLMTMGTLTEFAFTTDDVMLGGDSVAIESGRGEMTMTPAKGKPFHDKVKYLTVWKKQADGSWKIVRDINNTDLPPAK